jgi:outer membrane immunogenic protein
MHSADIRMGDKSLKTLKLALLGATFLIGAAGAASAADVYNKGGGYKDGPVPEYQQGISWTGFYFGANAGAEFIDIENEDGEDDAVFIGGIHVGYNWQKHGPWVFGIEGDVNFVDDEGTDYLASIRGRLGYAAGSTLLYATGGAAFLGLDSGDDDEDAITGFVVGGGLEHKIRENVSIGVEGLYYSFDGEDFGLDNEDVDSFTIRARLTYHLGGGYSDALK